jgi:CRISPR/Cas system CSM-associated protein Csm4 (group 5 of RAMP superfamily)
MRGGWVYDDPIKNVRMIKEGSVFNSPVTGTLVDVTPGKYTSHPVLKNGIGFYI